MGRENNLCSTSRITSVVAHTGLWTPLATLIGAAMPQDSHVPSYPVVPGIPFSTKATGSSGVTNERYCKYCIHCWGWDVEVNLLL